MTVSTTGPAPATVSIEDARRLAIAAQGFHRARPARVTDRQIGAAIRRLGLLQLDFVNVVVPSHYLVMFSRLGPYDRAALNRVVYGSGAFTEQWAHEASVVPMETWPLLRYRRETHIARPWGFDEIMREHHEYVDVPTRGTAPYPVRCSRRASAAASSRSRSAATTSRASSTWRSGTSRPRTSTTWSRTPPPGGRCSSSPPAPAASRRPPTSRTTSG